MLKIFSKKEVFHLVFHFCGKLRTGNEIREGSLGCKMRPSIATMEGTDAPLNVPIKSEDRVRQDREISINNITYREVKEVTTIRDRNDQEVSKVAVTRRIGNKVHQSVQLWQDGNSNITVNTDLNDDEIRMFNEDWERNFIVRYGDEEVKFDREAMGLSI